MSIIEKIGLWIFPPKKKLGILKPLERNEECYCGSGLKFKNCHDTKLRAKHKTAYKLVDEKNQIVGFELLKNKKTTTIVKSNPSWNDIIAGRGFGKIKPE